MPRDYSVIAVSKEVKKILARLKIDLEARNYDQVVRELLRRAGYEMP